MLNEAVAVSAGPDVVLALPEMLPMRDPSRRDRRVLEAYSEWLHYERRLLCIEMYPGLKNPDGFVPTNTGARDFHFPTGMDWRDRPQPSTRAAAILNMAGSMVGADWRRRFRGAAGQKGSAQYLLQAERKAYETYDDTCARLEQAANGRELTTEEKEESALASAAHEAALSAAMSARPTTADDLIAMIELFESRELMNVEEPMDGLLAQLFASVKAFVAGDDVAAVKPQAFLEAAE